MVTRSLVLVLPIRRVQIWTSKNEGQIISEARQARRIVWRLLVFTEAGGSRLDIVILDQVLEQDRSYLMIIVARIVALQYRYQA